MSDPPIIIQESFEIEFPNIGRLKVGEFLMNGSNSTVHYCSSNEDYVIKIHNPRKKIEGEFNDLFTVEHKLTISGGNLCIPLSYTFVGLQKERFSLVVLMKSFTEHMMLQDFIRSNRNLSNDKLVTIIKSILVAYQELHKQGWLHGDVSERNILIHPHSLDIQIIDFEWAQKIYDAESEESETFGTPELISPEVRIGGNSHKSIDSEFWSLCVIFMKLIEPDMKNSIRKIDEIGIISWIKENNSKDEALYRFREDKNLPAEMLEIIERGTTPNPEKRSTFRELILALPSLEESKKK